MSSRPPVVIVAYAYPPDPEIGSRRAYRFSKYLSRIGHPVRVLSATDDRKASIGESIVRTPGKIPGYPGKLASYVDLVLREALLRDSGAIWIPGATRYAVRWMKETPKPVVISTSPPIHTHLVAFWLKKWHKIAWIADFRDPMRDNVSRKASNARHFDPFLERRFVATADLVIANTDRMAAVWQSRYPEFAHKVRVLWNGFDPEDFREITVPPPRDYKLMSHVGDVYAGRDPMYMLRAVDRVIDKGRLEPHRLRISFHGGLPHFISSESRTFRRLRELGCVSHVAEELADFRRSEQIMCNSDLLLLVDFMEESRLQVPSKLYFYVRTGRAVVACTRLDSPAERILEKSGVPYVCLHPEDSEGQLEAGILKAASLPGGRHQPSAWFIDTFDGSRQVEQLSTWIEELA